MNIYKSVPQISKLNEKQVYNALAIVVLLLASFVQV